MTTPADAVSQPVQPTLDPKQETAAGAIVEHSAPSVFENSEPIREDQVQNAVKFLSHPKVKGSPVMYRRSFLEKKGLSREEIDEAFRRVPDASPATTNVPTAPSPTIDGHLNTSTVLQTVAPAQSLQLAAPVAASKTGLLKQFSWSHAFLAIGLLAASGAGTALLIKKSIIPRLKAWIRKVVSEEDEEKVSNSIPTLAEEAAAAAKAAAAAASDAAKVSQDLLNSKHTERRYFEEFQRTLDLQVQEMMTMSKSIRKLEENNFSFAGEDDPKAIFKKPYSNGRVDISERPVRSSTPLDNSAPPHSKSYMEILSMVQRGEKPDNIREINDLPPNPNQQLSNPRLAPITKPWESAQGQQYSTQVFSGDDGYNMHGGFNSQISGNGSEIGRQLTNSRIMEINADDNSRDSNVASNPAATRRWVPPQPPPVVMAEAAAAIRRPKSIRKETQSTDDDQASVKSSEGIDELQRVTKISELGGSSEIYRGSSEIQEEKEYIDAGDN